MSGANIALTAWSYALAALMFSAFSWHLLRRGRAPRSAASVSLLAAVLFSASWAWFGLLDQFSDKTTFQFPGTAADLLRYAGWYVFLLAQLRPAGNDEHAPGMSWLRPAATALVGAALLLQGLVALNMGIGGDSRIVLLTSMAVPVFAIVLVEQFFRNMQEESRWNAKPLCLGLIGTFVFDLYLYSHAVLFQSMDEDAAGIRGAVHALMVPLIWLSISRGRDWVSKFQLSRAAAFHSATLLIAGAYLVLISGVGYYVRFFGGEWGRSLQLALTFLALIFLTILMLSGTVRAKLRVLLGKHFFRYRYDYREEWLRFTQTLSAQRSPQEMGQQVVRGLADMLESPAGGLWTRAGSDVVFSNTARWNMAHEPAPEDMNSPFCEFLVRSGWVINLEEYRNAPQRYGGLVLPAWLLAASQAWLIVPLRVGDELIGFVVLASARASMNVNWEVNDLLKTAGRQAATFLAQMQATEALLEVRKFDAFNRMSAFVVHDLKNIVTQLSLMMKNAKRLHANPEFQQDMLMTVENSLERMRQLMLQLREGATPPGTAFGVNLAAVAQRIASVAQSRGRHLELQLPERLSTRGHEERLERVLGHIVQNAFDATEPSERVWLKIDQQGSQALVEVGDTGHGMSKEFVRDRLFKPFQTTKQSGMGIGAYESAQYVRELGGTIQVHSEPNLGTRVIVLLPLFEAQNESDLHMLKAS